MIRAQYGQSIYDIAMQVYGSVEGVLWLILDNADIHVNTILTPGQEIKVRNEMINQKLVEYYRSHAIQPATAITINLEPDGNFIITHEGDYILVNNDNLIYNE